MSRNGVIVLIGLGSLAAVAAGCNGGGSSQAEADVAALRAEVAALQAQSAQIDAHLRDLYPWLDFAAKAICQLEEKNPSGLDPALRMCPGGGTGVKPPPPYPPQP